MPVRSTIRTRVIPISVAVLFIGGVPCARGWRNLLADPGFEEYRLDPRGFYRLEEGAAWREITLGRGSVQFDASGWTAPPEMTRERPLGFSPGTTGFEGLEPDRNTGRIILEQDVVDVDLADHAGSLYEAWIWLAGAGRDDDNGPDRKEEAGGWEIFFYDNADPATWREKNAVEYHQASMDFYGEPYHFVPVSGFGRIPENARAFRMRVWATTWGNASGPSDFDTEVAVDNAHFAVVDAPNLLINGDFELDDRAGEMKGWRRPAAWPFSRNSLKPRDIDNAYSENFDHGIFRPFYGGRWSYGYSTYLDGWPRDAFTFSQFVDYDLPESTPLILTFNWIQNVSEGSKTPQLRIVGTEIELVVEYLQADRRISADAFHVNWPTPANPGSVGRYDQNAGRPYNPRFRLDPPAGTDRIGLHVSFVVNMPYRDGFAHVLSAIDDFWLGPAGPRQAQ